MQVGEDAESTADRLAAALWEVQTATPGIQRFVDKLATVFVPVVLTLRSDRRRLAARAGGTVAAAMLAGPTVLVVSCPCAMGLATRSPSRAGARDALDRGVVVTDASVFEVAREAERRSCSIKTGTLTAGDARVGATYGDDRALRRAAAVERRANHQSRTRSERRRPTTIWRASTPLWLTTVEAFTHSPRLGRLGNAR